MSRPVENPDKPSETFLAWKKRLLDAAQKAATQQESVQSKSKD
jgi:hypothetical protein